jgi:hypothetical protein
MALRYGKSVRFTMSTIILRAMHSRKISVDGEDIPSDKIGCRPDQREGVATGFDSLRVPR